MAQLRGKNTPIIFIILILGSLYANFYLYSNFSPIINVNAQGGTPIRVGIDRNAAPMEFEENGQAKGFNVDIMDAVADEAGFEVQFIFMDWVVVMESVKNGSLDVMFALDTPERHADYAFSRPILNITWRIFVQQETYGVSDLEDLEGRTVSVVEGFASHTFLLESGLDVHIVTAKSVPDALLLLERGDVFAFFGQYHLARYYIQQNRYQNIKVIGDVIDVKPFSIVVAKGNTALLEKINAALTVLFENGAYDKIYEKWYGASQFPTAFFIRVILPIILGLGGGILLLSLWTMSLRKKVREKTSAISKNLSTFQNFIEKTPFPVVIVAPDGKFEYVNPIFSKILGYSLKEIPDTITWFNTIYPDESYRNEVIQRWKYHTGQKIDVNDQPQIYRVSTRKGQELDMAFRLLNIEGGRVIVLIEDITLQQKIENQRLRQQQIESISLLAGGIAHDFNNILMTLLGYVNLMQMDSVDGSDQKEMLDKMEKSIQRATGITNQLLTFSKGGAPLKKTQSIEPIIRESTDFALHGSKCIAEIKITPYLPPIEIDAGQIHQSINNLLINASQAMPNGGKIKIEVDRLEIADTPTLDLSAGLLPGEYLRISISDSGPGIPYKDQSKIFTPYFTTKQTGSGLGLTTVYSIVKKHGGHIEFVSINGKGTTFTIYLPYSASMLENDEVSLILPLKSYFKNVIVMDDEPTNLEILQKMLGKLGFSVNTVSNGEDLIKEYNKGLEINKKFDLVITDLTIPGGLGGKDAVAQLKALDPDCSVIVISGFADDPVISNYLEYGFQGVLKKPFTFSDLQRLLVSILPKEIN
jgi:PAS domain S-box-containing protein